MRIVITGAGGQLGRELQRALTGHELRALTHRELDITNAAAVEEAIASFRPKAAVHAAALTDTTHCEREPDVAEAVNATGAANVAEACARAGAAMVYVSTNEVFDGKMTRPYVESDVPVPVNQYGRSKLAGERAVQSTLAEHYIVRTAWLYGEGGNNFVAKILSAAKGGELAGVTDEIATPTWTCDLAAAIAMLIESKRYGVYHFTNAGEASRYDWIQEIVRISGQNARVRPVNTAELRASLAANAVVPEKPRYSVLANATGAATGITLRDWREALAASFGSAGS